MSDVFRACASIVLLRSSEVCTPEGCTTAYQVLLVHKPRKSDAWQLPQGGCEQGESFEGAALRELKEETGLSARVLGISEAIYQYSFPASYRRFRPDHVCGQKVRFLFAECSNDAVVTVDGREIDGYVWALTDQISSYIHRAEYHDIVEQLVQEGVLLLKKPS